MQTLVKTLIGLCDGGQCGGEITLVTDGVTEAYAVVDPDTTTPFVAIDCDSILRSRETGAITVTCDAVDPDAEQRCTGSATFSRAALDAEAFEIDAAAAHMTEMEASD